MCRSSVVVCVGVVLSLKLSGNTHFHIHFPMPRCRSVQLGSELLSRPWAQCRPYRSAATAPTANDANTDWTGEGDRELLRYQNKAASHCSHRSV